MTKCYRRLKCVANAYCVEAGTRKPAYGLVATLELTACKKLRSSGLRRMYMQLNGNYFHTVDITMVQAYMYSSYVTGSAQLSIFRR